MIFDKKNDSPRVGILKTIPLFSQLTSKEIATLEGLMHERFYDKDEIIFDQGEEGLGLYVVIQGSVSISTGGLLNKRKELAKFGSGMFFGEVALLEGTPRSAQARATEPTELIGFFRPEFLQIIQTNRSIAAKVCYELARHLAQRLRETTADHSHHHPAS